MIKDLKKFGFNSENSTYVIAEVGINHGGNVNLAKKIIKSASKTGANAVKFQTYITEKRVPKDSKIFNILKRCELRKEDFKILKDFSDSVSMDFFSTPFDNESADYLDSIGVKIFKIASFDTVNIPLLKKVGSFKKTIIMSTGMTNESELDNAYNLLKKETDKIVLLHCVSSYPLDERYANLNVINTLRNKYDCLIGYSDHTNDIKIPLYAVAAGAQVIEKHYKISNEMDCVDSSVSITEDQMKKMVNEIRHLEKAFGNGKLGISDAEKGTLIFRRKIKDS